MIKSQLLMGLLFALVYRQIRKTMAAFHGPHGLPIMTFEVGKALKLALRLWRFLNRNAMWMSS